jgi:hypothetical protein
MDESFTFVFIKVLNKEKTRVYAFVRLETGDWRLETGDWGLGIGDWRLDNHVENKRVIFSR